MSNTERIYHQDLTNAEEALRPWLLDTEHGQFIDPRSAPEHLVSLHSKLVSLGYAKGWL